MTLTNNPEKFWYDRSLIHILSDLSVTDYTHERDEEGEHEITLTVRLDPVFVQNLMDDRYDFLDAATETNVTDNDVAAQLVEEVATALNIEFNTVGLDTARPGVYKRINERQWKAGNDEDIYEDYKDLLYSITGKDVDFNEETPSIPGLQKPFINAVADSPDHELPPPGAIQKILNTHIEHLRESNTSRKAVTHLQTELEREGVNARSASRIAKQMDDYLVTDAELNNQND